MRSIAPNTRTKHTLQEGQAIVLIALLILVLFGMLGLAIDSGRGYVDRRDQQTAVDAAALAAGDWYDNNPSRADLSTIIIPGALSVYQSNLRLYGGCTLGGDVGPFTTALGYPQDNWTAACGSYTLQITAINTQFNGYQFNFHSFHQLPLAFIQVFGGAPSVDIEAQASSIVGNQRQTPALLTLDPKGPCSTWVHGSGKLTLYGDSYSNGPICVDSNFQIAGNCYAASGPCDSATYLCYTPNVGNPYPPPPGGCAMGDVQGVPVVPAPSLPDPGYLSPEQQYYYPGAGGQYDRGTWTEMTPGTYNGFSLSAGGCYFLDAGVYTWNGGYSSHGALVSNELKPPGEADYARPGDAYPTALSFWGSQSCDGSFTVAPVPAAGQGIKHKNTTGPWGVVLTSVRYDRFLDPTMGPSNPCYNSPGCYRESAPSICEQVSTSDITSQGIAVTILKNAPGAQYYNVYVDPLGCEHYSPPDSPCPNAPEPCPNPANFTFYGTFLAPGWTDGGGPPASTLGVGPWTGILGMGRLGWAPCPIPTVTICNVNYTSLQTPSNDAASCAFYNARAQNCPPPTWEASPQCFPSVCASPSAAPQENAPMSLEYPTYNGGDLANENYCVVSPAAGSIPTPDPNAPCGTAKITPGAVQFYFPQGNNCLDQNGNGSTHVFSGEQYNWIVIYQVPSTAPTAPNTYCPSQKLNGNSFTQYIGTIYSPTSSWDILGANTAPLAGQVIAYDAQVTGSGNAGILFNPNYSPAPPAARLIN